MPFHAGEIDTSEVSRRDRLNVLGDQRTWNKPPTEQSRTEAPVDPSPPPIPLSSRPDLSASTHHRHNVSIGTTLPAPNGGCMICRDFSGPDHHASLFPRAHVTSIKSLAEQLTSPFPSPTDKARAIFTWLHYNIRYDVESFFGGNIQGSTPQSTLQSATKATTV